MSGIIYPGVGNIGKGYATCNNHRSTSNILLENTTNTNPKIKSESTFTLIPREYRVSSHAYVNQVLVYVRGTNSESIIGSTRRQSINNYTVQRCYCACSGRIQYMQTMQCSDSISGIEVAPSVTGPVENFLNPTRKVTGAVYVPEPPSLISKSTTDRISCAPPSVFV